MGRLSLILTLALTLARTREAALWAVDPPEYFTEGVYVAIAGPTYTAEQQAS